MQLYFIFSALLAFSLPFHFAWSSVCIIAMLVCWLVQVRFNTIRTALKEKPLLVIMMLLYMVHALSYFYSDAKGESAFDLERKLSLLILPLIVGCGPATDKRRLTQISAAFVVGVFLAAIFCIGRGSYYFITTHKTDMLFYHDLVFGLSANAVYISWYVITALGFNIFMTWEDTPLFRQTWVSRTISITLFIFLLLLSSRLLIVLSILVLSPLYLRSILMRPSRAKTIQSVVAGLIFLLVGTTKNPIRQRFEDVLFPQKAMETPTCHQTIQFTNLTLRLFLWKTAWHAIQEHHLWWFGCGNGDVNLLQAEQMKRIQANGTDLSVHENLAEYNLHNTYLQTLMSVGIPGLSLLLIIMISPLLRPGFLLLGNESILIFHVTSACFMLQESIFQTQAGVVFFLFFYLLCYSYYSNVKKQTGRKTTI